MKVPPFQSFLRLAHQQHAVVISCEMNLNMDYVVEKIWEYLALIRIFTKKPGNAPDLGVFVLQWNYFISCLLPD